MSHKGLKSIVYRSFSKIAFASGESERLLRQKGVNIDRTKAIDETKTAMDWSWSGKGR